MTSPCYAAVCRPGRSVAIDVHGPHGAPGDAPARFHHLEDHEARAELSSSQQGARGHHEGPRRVGHQSVHSLLRLAIAAASKSQLRHMKVRIGRRTERPKSESLIVTVFAPIEVIVPQ